MSRLFRLGQSACTVLPFIAALCATASRLPAQEVEEVFLRVRYEGVVDTVLSARFANDSIYIPVGGLFGVLGIGSTYAPETGASGFFVQEDRLYELDLAAGEARLDGNSISFEPEDYLAGDLDLFIRPGVLERIFGLQFTFEMRTLTLSLSSRELLPVLATAQRAANRSLRDVMFETEEPPRTTFGREPRLFDFGLMQYAIRVVSAGGASDLGFDLGLGAKVLGGDLRTSTSGATVGGTLAVDQLEGRWRYVFDSPRRLITQFDAGSLYNAGSTPGAFLGVRLTNQPVQPRDVSGSHVIEGETGPEWEVELYRDTEMVAYTRADSRGRYQFTVPLSYGTTALRIREYGPSGEQRVKEQRLEIPFTFLPPGQVDYRLSAGKIEGTDAQLYTGTLAAGVTDWFTARLGLDRRRNAVADHALYTAGFSARIAGSHLLEAEVAPEGLRRASVEIFPSGESRVGASIIRFPKHSLHNPTGRNEELRIHGYVPIKVSGVATNVRVAAGTTSSLHQQRNGWMEVETSVNTGSLRTLLGYRRGVQFRNPEPVVTMSEIQVGANWSVPRPLPRLRGLLLDAIVRYDKTRGRWQSVRLGASAGFGSDNHVNVALMHHFAEGSTTAELRFSLRPSFASSTTAARYQAGGVGLTQEVRGVLAYDAELGRVVPSAREWLGRGGVTVRMFRDTDGNGSFDPGEELVPGASIRLRQPARIERQDGLVRIHDLIAYHRYEAEVDPATLLDPGWAPAFTTFSFVSDPNVYRNIDIPFQETGILEGFVLQRGNVGYNGLGGLRVFLRRVDGSYTTTLQTFSDGGFYAFGLPPGRYEVSLDTTQLRLLDVRAEPEMVAVEVRPVDGQGSSDVRFALEPRSSDAIRADVVADLISSAENMGPAAADRAQFLMAAEAAEAEGELATSIELYHRILLQRPNDADVYLRIGHLLRALGDRTRALEAYRKTLSLAGRSIEAQRSLGLLLLELGEFVEAEQVLSQALVIDPSDLESRSALDELHGQAGSQP